MENSKKINTSYYLMIILSSDNLVQLSQIYQKIELVMIDMLAIHGSAFTL